MIPFNKPSFVGKEQEYIAAAIANRHISGDGAFTRACQAALEQALGTPKVLLTTSCTHALEMAALLIDLKPGDEVILPAFTFVSTVNAFALRGATPVFVDIRPDTLNIDEALIETAITPRTRAIVVVHYAGISCEMESILAIAKEYRLVVIEDNAHGLFATYRGKNLGTLGALATQSFHETKNLTCGEGGALVINDEKYIERAEILREKGTNRARFFRGQIDKYTWVDLGSSYVMSDLLAAFLLAQLEEASLIQQKRAQIWQRYDCELRGWSERMGVRTPTVPEDRGQSYHMYYLLLPSLEERTRFIKWLAASHITAVFHYQPLNRAPAALKLGARGECPVTQSLSDQLVRLPFYHAMTEEEQSSVISAVTQFRVSVTA